MQNRALSGYTQTPSVLRPRRPCCYGVSAVRCRGAVRRGWYSGWAPTRQKRLSSTFPRWKDVRVSSLSGEVSKSLLWWEKDTDLWVDVSSATALQEALHCPEYELCVVDWFATWCHGCRKTSPHLTELAADEALNSKVRFIRACVDGMSDYARRQGVKALPYLSFYDNTGQKLIAFGAAASKAKTFRRNIETALENPGMDFRLDQNGHLIPLDRVVAVQKEKEIDKAVQELRDFKAKLSANLNSKPLTDDRRPPPPRMESSLEEDSLIEERKRFLNTYGHSYGYGGLLRSMYGYELGRRLGEGQHYLDYTGSSVYTETQLTAIMKDFRENVFGNPHSENPSSSLSRDRIEEVRRMVLEFFDADPRHYQVIFTKSATAGLKIIGETYPWSEDSKFRYLRENHNSVLGIREYVLKAGGQFEDVTEKEVEHWIGQTETPPPSETESDQPTHHLFAFPAEDNFAGVKYPLSWIEEIQGKSTEKDVWKVMLDAAAFVGTQPLSLRQFPANYVAISFYKMFGYPTGLGALIARADDLEILQKVFWAGGSVALATSHDNFHVLKCRPTERLEDGTVAFLDIISLKHGFKVIEKCGGIGSIQEHVRCLTEWMYDRLRTLKHSNGQPLVKIFGKHGQENSQEVQGGILNFVLLGADGRGLSYKTFEREAAAAGFHIRTGNECNPGAAYYYLGIREAEVESLAGLTEGCDDELEYIQVKRPKENASMRSSGSWDFDGEKVVSIPLGSVRVSLGYMSTFEDCHSLCHFLESQCKDQIAEDSSRS